MRIYNISRLLAAPFLAGAVYCGYAASGNFPNKAMSNYILPLGLVVMLIYVFHNQINIWWLKKYPIPLDERDRDILNRYSAYYRELTVQERIEVENNIFLMIKTKEFSAMGSQKEEIPYDFKLIIAMLGVEMAHHTRTPLLENFDKVILYKHPFPTPVIKQLHTVEINGEDGVVLFAMDHLSAATHNPEMYYHIGYHGWAEAFMYENPNLDYPTEVQWQTIEAVSGFSTAAISGALGLPQIDTLPIGISLYFVNGEKMKVVDRKLYDQLESIFHRYEAIA